jgi:hypothetical protein
MFWKCSWAVPAVLVVLVLGSKRAGLAQEAGEAPGSEETSLEAMQTRFAELFGECLELVGTDDADLTAPPWPETRFHLFRARLLCPEDRILRYRYIRTRSDGLPDTVTLGVWIMGVDDASRLVRLDTGSVLTNVPVGAEIEIPVPVLDPWGELSEFEWLPFEIQSEFDFDTPPTCAAEASLLAEHGSDFRPHLEPLSARCEETLLAGLETRTRVWWLLEAVTPGLYSRGVSIRIRVLDAGEALVVRPRALIGRA